ncbi:MAG TPA: glycerol-3-phosphate 1-O-acyltransferase PlsY [Candidatus Butyricicoccus avicola]|nr:glycerol-3-phosphate 1-O-acyltransferase PlsY [Candidatus Butyricicoccus avicola]
MIQSLTQVLGPWGCALVTMACAYLLGSLSFAIIVCKLTLGRDIRDYGSGNAGLTNAYRTMGGAKTLLVLLGDLAKAAAALAIGGALLGQGGKLLAGAFVILGHVYPAYFGFRGGKGVLVGAMTLLLFDWRIFLIALGLFIVAVAVTRWVSLGSILGAISFPFTMYYFYRSPLYTVVAVVLSGAVIYLHRSNIKRILAGKENKFTLHSKPQITKDEEAHK